MLSASCPSCGSPLQFRHAAALTVVCDACGSCVVREGQSLADHGKIARFARELSPIQVGARGRWKDAEFEVVGVIRRGRDRVRWNEWAIVFSTGATGWIGEGNGQFQLFQGEEPYRAGDPGDRDPGDEIAGPDGAKWVVAESSWSEVVAAEGALPSVIAPGQRHAYLDLRKRDGNLVATLDRHESPPTFYTGRIVTLPQLELTGLRPFAGWSDPALVNFAGPEITATRALQCPGCGAALTVHAPGLTQRLACSYCGRSMDLDPDDAGDLAHAELLARVEARTWKPPVPLGTRGTLRGTPWQVIGAMRRAVIEEGIEYSWMEYFLFNPYRGSAWLVQDGNDHWSFVELLPCLPQPRESRVRQGGVDFRRFQRGQALVRAVLGEFTWEVQVGDRADTVDYIAPPNMLSMEHFGEEITWSQGTWLPADEVAAAFGLELPPSRSVAPHQPNPYADPAYQRRTLLRGAGLIAAAVLVLVLALALPARQTLHASTTPLAPGVAAYMAEPFVVPDGGGEVVQVRVSTDLPTTSDLVVSLLHPASGVAGDWTLAASKSGSTRTYTLAPGEWTLRIEPHPTPTESRPGDVQITVVRDPGNAVPAILALLLALGAPLAWLIDRGGFESRRWSLASE